MTLEEAKKEIEDWMFSAGEVYSISRNSEDKAVGDALSDVLGLLDEVKPVGNPDKLTLTELAGELRKLFEFKYLTVTDDWPMPTVMMWSKKPEYDRGWNIVFSSSYLGSFNYWAVRNIDLSEYKDADGNIDYSKCIVEVKE